MKFSFTELVLQLRSQCPAFNGRIGAVSEFNELTVPNSLVDVPYIFAIPVAEFGEDVDESLGTQVRITLVGFIVCVNNQGQKGKGAGKKATEVVDSLRAVTEELELAVLKWRPSTFRLRAVPKFVQQVTLEMDNTRLWVQINYQFEYLVRRTELLAPNLITEETIQTAWNLNEDIVKLCVHYGLPEDTPATWDDGWGAPIPDPEDAPTQLELDAATLLSTVLVVADESIIHPKPILSAEPPATHGIEGELGE